MKIVDPTNPPADVQPNPPQRTAQVLRFRGATLRDVPVDNVLDGARAEGLGCVIVLGRDNDGEEYFASSFADGADVLWLLERTKLRLLTVDPNEV